MPWSLENDWHALKDKATIDYPNEVYNLEVIDAGLIHLPSGKLVCADPFIMSPHDNDYVTVPKGSYPVHITVAHISGEYSDRREAFGSIIFGDLETESYRKVLIPGPNGNDTEEEAKLTPTDCHCSVGVDAGTVCFVDLESRNNAMPPADEWELLFDNLESPDCWFSQMDNETNVCGGIANIALPLDPSQNLVLFHSGWGDGFYPIIGSYDADGKMIAIHIDLLVCGEGDDDEDNDDDDEEDLDKN